MENATATFRDGRLELSGSVDWPDGTLVSVTPLPTSVQRVDWLSLPPFDVGEYHELSGEKDLLGEMLDDSRF